MSSLTQVRKRSRLRSNIVQLVEFKRPVSTGCVEIINVVLKDAKAGEVAAVAIVYVNAAGEVSTIHHADSKLVSLIGGITVLTQRLVEATN